MDNKEQFPNPQSNSSNVPLVEEPAPSYTPQEQHSRAPSHYSSNIYYIILIGLNLKEL
jgi:hypothetical protein